ncbi:MAG: glycosyltransferase [Deltaproteobacteria bacterium]|nr:glycosyltransferase [Deltaproteobacteria bacterium]MCB9788885.1 glycosyltransferase [Deltaproteobacteria bacterium]
MDWVVFGDDWGAHPSTTQHLVQHLLGDDRVVWVDSIGMRSPRIRRADLRRLAAKARGLVAAATPSPAAHGAPTPRSFTRVRPLVLPWHTLALARRFNARSLGRAITSALAVLGASDPVVLAVNPAAAWYLDSFAHGPVAYLRLDDYARLPGVDADLVAASEPLMLARAAAIFATARALMPDGDAAARARYLPQGVDLDHFASVPLTPPERPVLGFFGLVAEWIDFDLIRQVAAALPDWQLEFVGPVRHLPDAMRELPNVRWLPGVPYPELPAAISAWSAAWIPFAVDELTRGVNPLKAREYLAAGLPVACTPLPEVLPLAERGDLLLSADPAAIAAWAARVRATDDAAMRSARRASVADDGWAARSAALHQSIEAL